MPDLVTYESAGKVGFLTLNRPQKLNAITPALIADYHAALQEFPDDPQARVGILRGAGRAFCVGMDLSPENRYILPDAAAAGKLRAFELRRYRPRYRRPSRRRPSPRPSASCEPPAYPGRTY